MKRVEGGGGTQCGSSKNSKSSTVLKDSVKEEGPPTRLATSKKSRKKKIKFRCDFSATILDVLRDRGWWQVEEDDDSWNLFWCEVTQLRETLDARRLGAHQRVPHFRNHYELTRKNLLARNLKRLRRLLVREGCWEQAELCDCMPLTYELPSEYLMFVEEYRRQPGATWIVKPALGCQGRGIFLFQRLKDLADWRSGKDLTCSIPGQEGGEPDTYVVQRYVENPYLLAGRKFDIRLYVLVTSNYKWSLLHLRQFLTARHGIEAVESVVQRVAEVVLTSLRSVQKVMMHNMHCFELYGYDVLLDCQLRPWLLEVNASPSLVATDAADYKLKYGLLADLFSVLDLEGRLQGTERRVGGFDLLWDDGPVWAVCPGAADCYGHQQQGSIKRILNTYLGCVNDREDQLKLLEQARLL